MQNLFEKNQQHKPQKKYSKNGVQTKYAERPWIIDWTIKNLPDSFNFYITDFDLVIRDRSGNLRMLEIKTNLAVMPTAQKTTYRVIDGLIRNGLNKKNVGTVVLDGRKMKVQYHGFYVLTFEKNGFHDGKSYINGKHMTEKEIISFLSFEKGFNQIFHERRKAEAAAA